MKDVKVYVSVYGDQDGVEVKKSVGGKSIDEAIEFLEKTKTEIYE